MTDKDNSGTNPKKGKKPETNNSQASPERDPSDQKNQLDTKNIEINSEKKTTNTSEKKVNSAKNLESKISTKGKRQSNNQEKKENLFDAKSIPKMESTKNRKINFLTIFIFILLVLLFSISGWIFNQQQITADSIQTIKNNIKTDLATQKHKVDRVVDRVVESNSISTGEINQLKQGLQSLANHNNDLKLQLLSAQEKIKSLSGRRKQDWMLAEVEYLVNIAGLKLVLQKDRNTAVQLLKTADERLIEIADQSLIPIREAIARDISNLSLIQESDITGIVIALNTLDQQIAKLDLLALKFDDVLGDNILGDENTKNEVNERNVGTDKDHSNENLLDDLGKIYQRFVKEFIVIKEHAETPQPLMTPDQRGNLNRNIQLALQQAQIAVLQSNEQLYLMNLDKAINWIIQYFGAGAEPSAIIKQLKTLRMEKIDVRYPTQLESSTAIDEANKNQLYDWLDNSLNPSSKVEKNEIESEQAVEAIKQ